MKILSRVIILAIALGSLMPPASAQSPSPSRPAGEDEPDVVTVNTRLVTVPVSVRARDGRYVTDLQLEDFRIYEDGVKQQVSHFESVSQPIQIVLLIDYSVSIRADLGDIREIAADFLNELRPEDGVRAVAFGSDISILFGDSHDRPTLRRAILNVPVQGDTVLYDAVLFTYRHLISAGGGRKAIILFTDGVDTASHSKSYEKSLAYAEESEAPVYVVKYGKLFTNETEREKQGSFFLREVAGKSGGRFHFAGGTSSMKATLRSIAEELRAQYSLGYYPTITQKRGRRRKIRVRVNHPDVAVRARDSYMISGGDRQ